MGKVFMDLVVWIIVVGFRKNQENHKI